MQVYWANGLEWFPHLHTVFVRRVRVSAGCLQYVCDIPVSANSNKINHCRFSSLRFCTEYIYIYIISALVIYIYIYIPHCVYIYILCRTTSHTPSLIDGIPLL